MREAGVILLSLVVVACCLIYPPLMLDGKDDT